MYNRWSMALSIRQHFRWYEVNSLIESLNILNEKLITPQKLTNDNCPRFYQFLGLSINQYKRFPNQGIYFCDCEGIVISIIRLRTHIIEINEVEEEADNNTTLTEELNDYTNQIIKCLQSLLWKISNGRDTYDQMAFEYCFGITWISKLKKNNNENNDSDDGDDDGDV